MLEENLVDDRDAGAYIEVEPGSSPLYTSCYPRRFGDREGGKEKESVRAEDPS